MSGRTTKLLALLVVGVFLGASLASPVVAADDAPVEGATPAADAPPAVVEPGDPAEASDPVEPVAEADGETRETTDEPTASADVEPTTETSPEPASPPSPESVVTAAEPTPTPPPAGPRTIDSAQLRWGINNESNNRAHNGGMNFFSAGKIADPGSGGKDLPASGWRQKVGAVSIEKSNGTTYLPATWAGLTTDASGNPIASPASGRYSDHQVVIDGGTGTVDAAAGTATIAWTGDFTVLYYSGQTFFYVSNPTLEVVGGIGTLTATLGGFGASRDDASVWRALPDTRVTLADLGPVDLSVEAGFTVNPTYLGVDGGAPEQVTTGPYAGSFPKSFIDFQQNGGAAAFWFSSGSSGDAHKVPLPLTISMSVEQPVVVPPPAPPAENDDDPDIDNDAPTPPTTSAPRITTAAAAPPVVEPPASDVPVAAAAPAATFATTRPALTFVGASLAPDADPGPSWPWWVGGALLALSALVAAAPTVWSRRATSRTAG